MAYKSIDEILGIKSTDQKKQKEQEEKAQQLAPSLKIDTKGASGIAKILGTDKIDSLPTKSTQQEYESYPSRVNTFVDTAKKTLADAKPSVLDALTNAYQNALKLGKESTDLTLYAGGTGQSQYKVQDSDRKLLNLYGEFQRTTGKVAKYDTDFNYQLGEKTKNYNDYRTLGESGTAASKQEARNFINFGQKNSDTAGTAQREAAAAKVASDAQLSEMAKNPKTDEGRAAIAEEQKKRNQAKNQYGQNLINMLYSKDRTNLLNEAGAKMQAPDPEKAATLLLNESSRISEELNNGLVPPAQQNILKQRQYDIIGAVNQYRGISYGPEAPAVTEWQDWIQQGYADNYWSRYQKENAQEVQDWNDVGNGTYQGTDKQKTDLNDQLNAAYDELDLAVYERYGSDVWKASTEEIAAMDQRVNEAKAKVDALEAQLNEAAKAAKDKTDSITTLAYGENSAARLVGAAAWEGFTGFADKFYQAVDYVLGKPWTAVGQLFNKDYQSPITKWTGKYREGVYNPAKEEADEALMAKGNGFGWQTARNFIKSTVENLPNMIVAFMTGGANAAAGLAGEQAQAVDWINRLAGVGGSAANAINAATSVGKTTEMVIKNLLSDYNYWTSFMQEISGDVEEAQQILGENANPYIVAAYAMGTCFINSGIEIGGSGDSGIQGLTQAKEEKTFFGKVMTAITNKDWPLLESLMDSADDEMMEELKQGLTSGLMKKALLDHDLPWMSLDGSDAVFNAKETAESMWNGWLMGLGLAGVSEPVGRYTQQRAADIELGNAVLSNQWGDYLGRVAKEAGVQEETAGMLQEGTIDQKNKGQLQKVGRAYREWLETVDEKTKGGQEAMEAASAMLSHNKGEIPSGSASTQEAINTGKELAKTAKVSEDGKTHVREKARGKRTGTQQDLFDEQEAQRLEELAQKARADLEKAKKAATRKDTEEARQAVELGEQKVKDAEAKAQEAREKASSHTNRIGEAIAENAAVELIGVEVKNNQVNVKVKENGETKTVPFDEVEFPDQETADRAAIAAMVGNEELANSIFNAKVPGNDVPFATYAKEFADAYDAAKTGLGAGAIKAAGLGEHLHDTELQAAVKLGQISSQVKEVVEQARQKTIGYIKSQLRGKVEDTELNPLSEAMLKQQANEELTEQEEGLIDKYSENEAVQEVNEEMSAGEAPTFGENEAYQLGRSGRRMEELESTLDEMDVQMTDEIRSAFERGQADLAQSETDRIRKVKQLNAGENGTRVGVLRSISMEEAERAGVNMISGKYTSKQRDAITALRGLAETTGVNLVLFESKTQEGEHTGANGWYDRDTRTAYLDVNSGKGNEQALLRTAAHELTHFIQDWSIARYKQFRDFVLDYYYGLDKDTIKNLIQEQMDKNPGIDEVEAMDEVIADASEKMISGDGEATKKLAEEHPSLFVRIRGWIDTWAKAISKAWRGITGSSNEAARLLEASAETWSEAQKMWWGALEEASIQNRGEIREAEIDLQAEEAIKERKDRLKRKKKELEQKYQEAIGRANQAETAEEGQEAVMDAQQYAAEETALEEQEKQEEKQIKKEAEEEKQKSKQTEAAGRMIQKRLDKMDEKIRRYVESYAEKAGIALDGTMESGIELTKTALHYYNQGKAGIAFTPNTEAGRAHLNEFAQEMSKFGLEVNEKAMLEAAAETHDQIVQEVVESGFDTDLVLNKDAIRSLSMEDLQPIDSIFSGKGPNIIPQEEETQAQDVTAEEVSVPEAPQPSVTLEVEEPTPTETAAGKRHAATVTKMDEVMKGLPKKARNLVMKWGTNEWVNVNMEDGSDAGVAFASFAVKWYNAGKEGTSFIHVPFAETDAKYPAFLQQTFYDQGKADAEAEKNKELKAKTKKKATTRKGAKKNEKPADERTVESAERDGDRTERVLENVSSENVQEPGGEGRAVPAAEEQGRADVRGNGRSDEPGTVRERGEGVHQSDDVRPAAGKVTEEATAQTQAEEATEELRETVETVQRQLETETPRGTNYRIGESLDLPNGEKARFHANVDAIRLLKQLEAESRYATPEEQEVLSKYVGWGGLAQAFDQNNEKWTKEYEELLDLLTEDEYNAARASTMNAHYTSIEVIRAMYDGLQQLGFKGGRMLEPSGGIGHFIGAMPADMQKIVRSWTMVELDSITGRIAAKLYPNADVRVQGFEEAKIGDNIMDVAIGNVPFGDYPIIDNTYPKSVTGAIHNYFFAKAIDKVRPGGIMMFITSRYTMDASNYTMREYMMERADLLGAIRLPNTAFKGNAGTEVVTDILVFKKRQPGTLYAGVDMHNMQYTQISGTQYAYINEYFVNNPEMILGTMSMQGSMYSKSELTVDPKPGNLGDQIREAFGNIKGQMDYTIQPSVEELQQRAEKARKNTKPGGYEVRDGKLFQNINGELIEAEMTSAEIQRVKGMLTIRDTARELMELQKRGAAVDEIVSKRKELNTLYDEYVAKNGNLHNKENSRLMKQDPDQYFLKALENYDKLTKVATKSEVFEKNTVAREVTINHVDTAQDAITVVLNEKGYIDLARAAELLGVSESAAQEAMLKDGLAFLNMDGGLDTRERYLSGDVRAKLRQAESMATLDPRYQKNVEELQKVIPEDISHENIYVQPGATWIPDSVYEQFFCSMLHVFNNRWDRNVTIKYIPQSGEYTIEVSNKAKKGFMNKEEWGTPDRTFVEIMGALMNNRKLSVNEKNLDGKYVINEAATLAVKEKAEKIKARFSEWLWENEERTALLEQIYNDKYNAIVVPEYDGTGLTIPGASEEKQLREHQRNVVHRIIQNHGNTLIAHCVGAGKTAEMAGAAMKLRQLGIVQKPTFVVPKALVSQWGSEFLDFFPTAKILVLSETAFNEQNRKEFANRITTGDYDAIIMSREQFGKIPMSLEYTKQFYQKMINEIVTAMDAEKRNSGKNGMSVKNLEKTKKRLEAKLTKLEIEAKDTDNINFEDMGIDSIFVDEAHEYKNLMFVSNMNNVSGLGDRDGSKRAFDMYMKTRYLRELNGGRGIVFATATPVMNSMSEMYIMQKYLAEDTLDKYGIRSFDAWANLFGEVITVIEPTPSGKGYRQKEAFARFKNLPELQRLFRDFADVKTKIEGLKIPKMKGGKRITIECEPGQFQLDYIDKLAERAGKLRSVDPKEDNMLKITSEGRKLSYTQRMIDPSLPYEEDCKVIRCVDEVEKVWKESKGIKGTQLIFCDMATPKGSTNKETDAVKEEEEDAESVNFYGDIKQMLIARGVPAEEIAFIHDANTNEKKLKLFDDVNNGTVRVLIGSTAKMGVGMNAQKRIVALHHLDAPWRPGDIEQREGRALRQKNMNDEVAIYVYVTKKTFDTRMWDNLYRKASFINQIMNGTNTAREVEGDGDFALSAAEIKAIATGDPMLMEQFDVNNKIKQLEKLEQENIREKKLARDSIRANTLTITKYENAIPAVEQDQKLAALIEKDFRMKVDGKSYDKRTEAAGPLLEAALKHEGIPSEKKIGEVGGFSLYADGTGSIVIKGAGTYSVNANFESDTGTMSRVMNKIANLQENLNNMKATIERLKNENEALQKKQAATFEKSDELQQLRMRAEEIAKILNPVEDQAGAEGLGEDEDTEVKKEKKVKYSSRAANITKPGNVEEGMDDNERYYAIVRNSRIKTVDAAGKISTAEIDKYKYLSMSKLIESLEPVAKSYGLIKDGNKKAIRMQNKNLNVEAIFSKRSLNESLHKQEGSYANFIALLPVFKETYENAVPVLVQGDRYQYAVRDESSLSSFVYLLGAFKYNGKIIPVQFELKHINKNTNTVYVVVTIKENAIVDTSTVYDNNVSPAPSEISIEDVIANVNPNDTNILANIPARFLTEEQKAGKRLGLEDKGIYIRNKAREAGKHINAPVNMTTERIDQEIHDNGAEFTENYSKAYMTYIDPSVFLELNTINPESKQNESRAMVARELREERQTPFMTFDPKTGQITGHEGRHRMASLAYAGIHRVAILMKPDGREGINNREIIEEMEVKGKRGNTVTMYNLIPVNKKHRQELIDTYGDSDNWFKYSSRDESNLSDRQLLARAFEGVAKNEPEREMLARYKTMIAKLDTDTEKANELRQQIHEKTFVKGKTDRLGATKLRAELKELERDITAADKMLMRMEGSQALLNVLRVERNAAEKRAAYWARQRMERYKEGMAKREYANQIRVVTDRLAKWIVQPSKTGHVPKSLKTSLAKFLLSIDQGRGTEFTGKGSVKKERNFLLNMRELQNIVSDISAYQMMGAEERVESDFGAYIDLPDGFYEQMGELISSIEGTMMKVNTEYGVDDMSLDQARTLYQVLTTISSSITKANDFLSLSTYKKVSEAAQNTIGYIRNQGKVTFGKDGQIHNFLNWENIQPIRAFARFGEGGEAVFKGLMAGQAQMARNVKEVIEVTESVYTSEEARKWSEEIKTFNLNGKKVSMPVADVMSMYCLMKRAQAVGHILGEGFRVADFKDKKGKTIAGSGVTVTEEEAKKIVESLTPRQKEVADKLQHLMSTMGSKWGNYVSMKRFGYEMFTEKNYFPIEVDSERLAAKTDTSKGNELYRLLNLSSVKPITRGANNRLMLKNIFEVYASHMSDMAQYNAMGLPVLDAIKWINYRERFTNRDGTIETAGVRDIAREMYGNKSQRYIIELLKDVNGTQATGEIGETISRKMLMRFNRQAVAANLSVAAKQPTSIIRAAMELGGMDLIRGAMGNEGMLKQNAAEMLQYSGIAVWKDLGFYDVNVSRPVKQMIMHTDSAVDRLLDLATWPAEKADKITWAAMWGACKAWVKKNGGKFENTEDFMHAVADKFEDVIYKTQVVDSILTRSQFMRGTSFMSKSFSSFMSEPTTTYNMMLDVWHNFRNDMRKGMSFGQAFVKHKDEILRAASVYMVSAAVMTILEALIGAWRDEDDYETFMEKFEAGILDNAIDEVLPFNLLPVVSDIYDYAKKLIGEYVLPDEWGISSFAGGSSPVYSALDTLLGAASTAEKYFSGTSKYTLYAVVYKTANALSQMAGVPVAPAMREVVALWNNTMPAWVDPGLRIETYDSGEAQGAAALYKALTSGDKEREAKVRRQLSANDADEKKVISAMKSLIKEDKEKGRITEEQALKYLEEMTGMESDDAWFKVREWESGGESYSRFDDLKNALITGVGVEQAKKDLTDHGYKAKEVTSKVNSLMADAAKKNEITDAQATDIMVKYGGLTRDEAYWKLQEAHYEKKDDDDSYSKYGKLKTAVLSGTGYEAAKRELTSHGVTEKEVQSQVRSIITDQSINNGMSDSRVISLLKQYGGMDDNEAWIRTQELQYQKLTKKSTTSDIAMVNYAIERHSSPKEAIDALLAHGKSTGQICSSMTSRWHDDYIELWKTDKTAAATLKGQLISIYDYIGYPGNKKVTQWEKDEEKKNKK